MWDNVAKVWAATTTQVINFIETLFVRSGSLFRGTLSQTCKQMSREAD